MEIRELVREDIRDLVPYEPQLVTNVIKLDANENPHPFPPVVMREIYARLVGDDFTRYPDPLGSKLKAKLADSLQCRPDNIVLGNGSDELIQLLLQTFGGPGKRVIIPAPTFSMYRIHGEITGTIPVEVPRDENFGLDMELLLTEMKHPATRVTFIATPNNPTGNCIPVSQIRQLLSQVASLVVVDEAYIDFGGESCLPLLLEYNNLVLLRTFSKVGLAGLRVGYLAACREVTVELAKVKQPYNVNTVSQTAALAVLDHWALFAEQISEIAAERERLADSLGKIPGVKVFPSQANFILFKVPVSTTELHRKLQEQGILLRKDPGSTHGLKTCLRVSVGTRQENDIFLEKLNTNLLP